MKTTISAAAEYLNVSKTYLQKLLDEGAVTLEVDNLIMYRLQRDTKRRRALAEMSAFLQDEGFYDD
jgi:hypothetical protein